MQGERRREREKVRERFHCIKLEDVLLCLINFPTSKVCNKIKVVWMQRPERSSNFKNKIISLLPRSPRMHSRTTSGLPEAERTES
jgi:hypothetical protein